MGFSYDDNSFLLYVFTWNVYHAVIGGKMQVLIM